MVTLESESATRPTFVSIANNTAVSHRFIGGSAGYGSTLGGVVALGEQRWMSVGFWYPYHNTTTVRFIGQPAGQKCVPGSPGVICYPNQSPWQDVMQSLNKLMVFTKPISFLFATDANTHVCHRLGLHGRLSHLCGLLPAARNGGDAG